GGVEGEGGGAEGVGGGGAVGGLLEGHQGSPADARVVAGALRAVAAVLGAAARLDAQQRAPLHVPRVVVRPVDLRGAEHQLRQRKLINTLELVEGFHGGWYTPPGEWVYLFAPVFHQPHAPTAARPPPSPAQAHP